MGAKTISFVNMKGGVAKTTTTVGLATVLASDFGKKVLVIDLDPQTNATGMLIGEEKWEELSKKGRTLYSLFHDAAFKENTFSLEDSIQKNVSRISSVHSLDLLPSDIYLMDLEYQIAYPEEGTSAKKLTMDILEKVISPAVEYYDYILIDCPPNLGMFTLNGLNISQAYVIPTIPDILSTRGIHSMIQRIPRFVEQITCLGIVFTKVNKRSSLHTMTMKDFEKQKKPKTFEEKMMDNAINVPVFKTVFYESNYVSKAAEYLHVNTMIQKWGNHGHYENLKSFAQEILSKI